VRRTLVLLTLLLCSCSLGSPGPTETPPPTIEAEEYAVYSDMIRENPIGYDLGSIIVIREQTVRGDTEMLQRTLEEDRRLPAKLVDSYRSRNAKSYTLGRNLDLEQDYALMPEEDFQKIFSQQGLEGEKFPAKYPESGGAVFFSRVGFGAKGDEALVEMGFRCDGLCGAGGLYLLTKEDGSWKVKDTLLEWMS